MHSFVQSHAQQTGEKKKLLHKALPTLPSGCGSVAAVPRRRAATARLGWDVLHPRWEHTSVPARSPPRVLGTAQTAPTECQKQTRALLLPPRSSCHCGESKIIEGSATELGPSAAHPAHLPK